MTNLSTWLPLIIIMSAAAIIWIMVMIILNREYRCTYKDPDKRDDEKI